MTDLRAIDVVRRGDVLALRLCGDGMIRTVGARAWARPRFAKGRRMYARCGIGDPWDPDVAAVPLDLPNVGMQDRRPVAPHAAPPKAAAPPAGFSPRIPMPSKPAGLAPGEGSSGLIGQTRKDDTAELRRKMQEKEGAWTGRPKAPAGGDTHRVAQPLKPLPVRPGFGPTTAAAAPVATPSPSAPPPNHRPAGPPRMSIAPEPARGAPAPRATPPVRVADGRAGAVKEPEARALPARAPPPVGKVSGPAPRSGGFRMAGARSTSVDNEPEELPLDAPLRATPSASSRPAPPVDDGPEEIPLTPLAPPAPAPAPVRPARPGGLDDLFGMGNEPTTRIRIPKAEAPGEQKPRRPMVSDPASLAGGVDRRPPPPKPPVVKPSGSSGGGNNDLPDE